MGGCDLVCGRCQRFTFGCVLPLPADRTFRFGVHDEPFDRLYHGVAVAAAISF
jgi:hypothetical protein